MVYGQPLKYVFNLISVSMQRERDELVDGPYRRDFLTYDNHILDGDIFLQALNGFLMILDCNGELFFATHTIETYLGFHQSDVIHQSVYELVHSEDREELQRQLGMCKDFFEKGFLLEAFLKEFPSRGLFEKVSFQRLL